VEDCGPCPAFASFSLAFDLQLRKKHGKTSVRVGKTSASLRKTSVKVKTSEYHNISLSSSKNLSGKSRRENENTHFRFNHFSPPKIAAFMG